ncbi:hypothetical protein LTR37_013611 [Vermiconidia calcicola]|uniref:Uncharacterized protein n=1 Tax=Vermiconidia calcicola TaxID=1690605 RepID=A0ACC3MXE9_9PEZI|nr:hypothetical protein LTR37_013611 [Vermiconidia calcicola]
MTEPETTSLGDDDAASHEQGRLQRELENSNCAIIKLPAELRNRIYDEVIPHEQRYSIPWMLRRRKYSHFLELALSQTCRALRMETIPVFFANNTFHLGATSVAQSHITLKALECLPTGAVASLRKVCVSTIVDCNCSEGYTEVDRMDFEINKDRVSRPYTMPIEGDLGFCMREPGCQAANQMHRASGLLDDMQLASEGNVITREKLAVLFNIFNEGYMSSLGRSDLAGLYATGMLGLVADDEGDGRAPNT